MVVGDMFREAEKMESLVVNAGILRSKKRAYDIAVSPFKFGSGGQI
jgi:hypothetical protein